MTEASRHDLPAEIGDVMPRLTIRSDGAFTAVEYPRPDVRGGPWIAHSGRGTWSIEKVAGTGDIYLRFDDDFGDQLWMSNFPDPPGHLYFWVGDPDSGHRIQFTRSS
jgi:hypothetical protein